MAKALESPLLSVSFGATSINAVITEDNSGKSSCVIEGMPLTTAGTEYTFTLPLAAKGFLARTSDGVMSIRFTNSGDYLTVTPGGAYSRDDLSPASAQLTLYVKSSSDNDTLTVESWI